MIIVSQSHRYRVRKAESGINSGEILKRGLEFGVDVQATPAKLEHGARDAATPPRQ
jgi:hypothetical protein